MGGACSTDEETRHHRENKKNRSNPTESYDTWKQKMLLDIGVDPLAVVRDFPRMIVYVGTEKNHNYLPAGCENSESHNAKGKATGPSRRPSENPLARCSGTTPHKNSSGKRGEGKESSKNNHNDNTPGAMAGPSPQPPPRLYSGTQTSQREPFRDNDDDAFAARLQRVREEVLLLSELCDERGTFGAAFETAWDRLVAQGNNKTINNDGATESEAVSEYIAALQHQPIQQQQESNNNLNGAANCVLSFAATKRSGRPSLPLDVHQVLLNACVDSGMIALVEETYHTAPTSTTLRAIGVSATHVAGGNNNNAPPPRTHTSPSGASRVSRPTSAPSSGLQLPETTAATGLLSEETPADYGAGDNVTKTGKSKGILRQGHERDGAGAAAKSSSNSQIRDVPSLATPGMPSPVPGTVSRYVVRSATFHLMQFATQGVMFFPVQRLKHVLWVPWSSHMQDVLWTIHYTLTDATLADVIALKQHTLNALYNNISTVPPNEGNAAEEAGVGDPRLQPTTSTVLAANNPSTPAEQTADAFDAAATTSLLSEADKHATSANSGGGGNNAPARHASSINMNNNNNITPQQSGISEQRSKRKIIVIQHVQTGRHYVDEADRKTTPRYELDWACSIRVDQESLENTFAPFQHLATQSSVKVSPMLVGDGTSLFPTSQTRCAAKSDVEGVLSTSAQQQQPQREVSELDGLEKNSAVPAANFAMEGIASSQQSAVLQREVVTATVEVVSARVERPPQTMCMVSSTWKKRREELGYVLEQQYSVRLEDTDELRAKRLY